MIKPISFIIAFLFVFIFQFSEAEAKQKVLILYSTGGHVTAAKSVEAMLENYPEEFEIVRHDFAEELTGFAHWFYFGGYDLISRRANWINKLGVKYKWYQAEIKKLYASQRFNSDFNQPENVLRYIQGVKPDIIITTHFSLAESLALLREKGYLKTTPIAWTHLDAVDNIFFQQIGDQLDMSFVPTEEMATKWQKTLGEHKVIASGIPIMPDMLKKRDFSAKNKILKEMDLKPDIKTILLMGGSMGALSYEKIIRDTVKAFAGTPVQFIAVCGRNEAMKEKLDHWTSRADFPKQVSLRTTGFINSEQIKTFQIAADLIVSKPGGLTTFELLTTNRPVIMTEGIGEQEYYNAKFVDEKQAAIFIKNIQEIGSTVVEIFSNKDLQNKLIIGQERLRSSFQLSKIVDWTRHAEVTQPYPPEKTVLEKIEEAKNPVDKKLDTVLKCKNVFPL